MLEPACTHHHDMRGIVAPTGIVHALAAAEPGSAHDHDIGMECIPNISFSKQDSGTRLLSELTHADHKLRIASIQLQPAVLRQTKHVRQQIMPHSFPSFGVVGFRSHYDIPLPGPHLPTYSASLSITY